MEIQHIAYLLPYGNRGDDSIFLHVYFYGNVKHIWFQTWFKEDDFFFNLCCNYNFCDMLREVDRCLKFTFSHFITLKNKNQSQSVNILSEMFQILYKQIKSAPFYF
jgi:hypothetical protein